MPENDESAGSGRWLTVADAARARGDLPGEEAAIRRRLTIDGRDIRALLAMGHFMARTGDVRAACSHYRMALKCAAGPTGAPWQLHGLLREAAEFVETAEANFARQLHETLTELGPKSATASPRVAKTVGLLLGEVPLHLQQPSMLYFPELAQRPFFERDEFDWVAELEAQTPLIRRELVQLLADDPGALVPQTEDNARMPRPNSHLLNDPSWSVLHLWRGGEEQRQNTMRVPATVAALSRIPIPRIWGFSPMVMFSVLRPGTHIPAHHGLTNVRLICHLPILVPEGSTIRVGSETRSWEEGRTLIFDDSIEHEAWNRGNDIRVVLLFDIWRPDITPVEREQITALIEAVKRSDRHREAA